MRSTSVDASIPSIDGAGAAAESTCETQCVACASTFGSSVEECVAGCELSHRRAIDYGCEDAFVEWSACVEEACYEVTRCDETHRVGACF